MKEMEKKNIKWEWRRMNGNYEGEVKNNIPHGVGRWKSDDGKWTVYGEWKDGKQNGKTVVNHYGTREEYEAKDGKYNGKLIRYYNDRSRWQAEFKGGKQHGRHRTYNMDGVITYEEIWENGRRIKILK